MSIVRPSLSMKISKIYWIKSFYEFFINLVTCCHAEPIPGWIDSTAGPAHYVICVGKGLLKSMHGIPSLKADLIPVDMVRSDIVNDFKINVKILLKLDS